MAQMLHATVQRHFYRWGDDGTCQRINHELVRLGHESESRATSLSAGVIDSQSVKTTEAGGPRGFDAGKKIKGANGMFFTDTAGLLIAASCMQPASRIATARPGFSARSEAPSRGCVRAEGHQPLRAAPMRATAAAAVMIAIGARAV